MVMENWLRCFVASKYIAAVNLVAMDTTIYVITIMYFCLILNSSTTAFFFVIDIMSTLYIFFRQCYFVFPS